ncbi:hypothetical protein Q9L58_009870 [Maublancomyces gigas]|uniref:Uncharacterized protein n=1 Tax=Discina gigas TaxID=1032678 RepID=A0ABR3G6R5_9PEZI
MELGFSVAAGPLSQISVSLFSIELAVQLATGAYGWWKAGARSQSLSTIVDAKGAKISAASTFHLLRYVDKRTDSLIRGVARTPSGVFSCVTLSNASTASAGDSGIVCLRAVVCALLCFYNVSTTVEILASALPGTLYTSDQEGGNETIEGPLLSSFRDYVKAAAVEEDNDELRQKLQAEVDSKLLHITGATSSDVFKCDDFLESDAPNFVGALRWILTPVVKRNPQVYPTRSLKVWALAEIMYQLGFEVSASMSAVSSKGDYETYVEKAGYQATYQEVILVTSSDGPTDLSARGTQATPSPSPRIGSIRSIPWIAFRHLSDSKSHVNTKYLSDVWVFTFNHVCGQLELPGEIDESGYGDTYVDFVKPIRDDMHRTSSNFLPQNSMLSSKLQWLTFVIYEPLKKFLPPNSPRDNDSIWSRTNIDSQIHGLSGDYLDPPHGDDADDWYVTRTVAIAAIYALCCKWLHVGDPAADMIDTEVAFCPDFIRRGNLQPWTSFKCFNSRLYPNNIPSSFDAQWRFCAGMSHKNWLHLLYLVFSGLSKDTKMAPRIEYTGTSKNTGNTILGFQENGISLIPSVLSSPSSDPRSWFRYLLHVGQLVDLPLDDDGFVCHSNKPFGISSSEIWEYGSTGSITKIVENLPSDTIIRLDVEPWWEFDERTVVFRVRVGGIVKAIFGPDAIYKKSHYIREAECNCPIPKTASIELDKSVVVLHVSDILSNYTKRMMFDKTKPYEKPPVFIQTGGDMTSQLVCLALSPFQSSQMVSGCLDAFTQNYLSDFNLL